jgi:hypothetical protein
MQLQSYVFYQSYVSKLNPMFQRDRRMYIIAFVGTSVSVFVPNEKKHSHLVYHEKVHNVMQRN